MSPPPKPRRWRKWAALLGVAIAFPAGLFGLRFGYEHADYEVEQQHQSFEVRRYSPRIVAEVTVEANDARQASQRGFSVLADYIFGNNLSRESIAMTTPVEQQSSESVSMTTPVDARSTADGWTICFTMPSRYTIDQLPKPVDARVQLRQVDATRFAAIRFSGVATAAGFERYRSELEQKLTLAGLSVPANGPATYSQYDPPWTPGFLRRNEVMIELSN